MNEQKPPNSIEWTRVHGRRGFTSNPIFGCVHDCRWRMPNGEIAICYADTIVQKFMPDKSFQKLAWQPEEFKKWSSLREGAGIFVGSMSDVFGVQVPDDWIVSILNHIRANPQHIFFLLTKNAPRLKQFSPFPDNAWIGASVPPTFMHGHELSATQQVAMLRATLKVLGDIRAKVRWMSIEPLSWDMAEYFKDVDLEWTVIGAASNGNKVYQPDPQWVRDLLRVLDAQRVSVFFKGNLRGNDVLRGNDLAIPWRQEFPKVGLPVRQLPIFGEVSP